MALGDEFDAVLIAAQHGAEWAFTALYRAHNPRLLRYFAARVPAVAEDLAAETWLGVARQLHQFRGGEDAFRAWMFTIAHRRLVQHWRDEGRRRLEAPEDESPGEVAGSEDPENDVVEMVAAQEAARRIAELLTPDQAEIVLLRILAGLDVDQVAAIVGKRAGNVRVTQHKALRRLAEASFLLEGVTL